MAVAHPGQSSLVHSLATLLRNNGDMVLDGSSTLTLPACSLQQLTRLFEQHLLSRSQQHGFLALPSHPADTSSLLQLQFLFDVLQKTISLKLINPPGELLSLCGGDLSSALPWLELHTLNFSYNSILCLDQSLGLLNVLKSLDLSHNKIQDCEEFLKPLTELEHLNLGYNCLQRAPVLSPSSRAKLHTLVLRNNQLETINGVEQLSSLQHLDLAYNLLLEHSQLAPLSLLHCLCTLNLEGNPLFFQRSHRTATVRHLSPKAAGTRLRLDGTPLTSSELSDTEVLFPALELHFNYIVKEKRCRRFVLLDDDPQQAAQVLNDILSVVVEENQRRHSELIPNCVRLQCLRCRSEFTSNMATDEEEDTGGGRGRSRGGAAEGQYWEEQTEADSSNHGGTGKTCVCPECGSDHVVQVAELTAPLSSTPISQSPRPESKDHLGSTYSGDKLDDTKELSSCSLFLETAITSMEPSFATAQGTSFFIGDGPDDTSSLSYNTEHQSKEDLAGSYHYSILGDTPTSAEPTEPSIPKDDLDLLSEENMSVDHRLKLFLDMEVFEEEEEELHSFLKMSAVKFGELGEVPSLLVVSNQRLYFLEMMSDVQGSLADRLRKKDSYPIVELSYLEVGLGSQSIHMKFADGGVAYTLLVRDSVRCKRFFGLLTGIVREKAHKSESMLQSISTTRLSIQHHLWPLVCEDIQADVEDGQLQFFYVLAFVLRDESWLSLTVLATRETLYLLEEDHQWSKTSSAVTENSEACSGNVVVIETLPISCVSSVVLLPSDQHRMDIKLFDETMKQEKTWCVRLESAELLQGLLSWVRTQWEAMFGVKLQTSLQDDPS
ncbi:PREDICTED: serine/threonine-protein kinase 11-interacting protein [Cyprinodon variegatus]|uniref:serine/threonine-protein kinase 11-interacting protein n=1 Tax=Cyprinodon variegatus TaxID=28743 RepID=UPI0007425F2A|nr:PREDICTED: serine/threonine-protein kinase 11-interacting protein [Cyprinodon variegatus]